MKISATAKLKGAIYSELSQGFDPSHKQILGYIPSDICFGVCAEDLDRLRLALLNNSETGEEEFACFTVCGR